MVKSYKSPNMTSFHRPVPSDAKSAERSRLHAEFVEDGPTAVEGNSMVEWGIAKGLGNDQSTVTREGEREREIHRLYRIHCHCRTWPVSHFQRVLSLCQLFHEFVDLLLAFSVSVD